MIDELLEELGGAKLLTKLDLLFVYYQVAMYSPNIEKIAFWTHHGHFEFLVIAVWTLQHSFHLSDLDEWDISSLLEEIYSGFLWLYFNFQSNMGRTSSPFAAGTFSWHKINYSSNSPSVLLLRLRFLIWITLFLKMECKWTVEDFSNYRVTQAHHCSWLKRIFRANWLLLKICAELWNNSRSSHGYIREEFLSLDWWRYYCFWKIEIDYDDNSNLDSTKIWANICYWMKCFRHRN